MQDLGEMGDWRHPRRTKDSVIGLTLVLSPAQVFWTVLMIRQRRVSIGRGRTNADCRQHVVDDALASYRPRVFEDMTDLPHKESIATLEVLRSIHGLAVTPTIYWGASPGSGCVLMPKNTCVAKDDGTEPTSSQSTMRRKRVPHQLTKVRSWSAAPRGASGLKQS